MRIPSLFQQNVLKAVSRTQIEGICKVYAGKTNRKTNWKLYLWSLASKKWGAIEALLQMTPIQAFICSKVCDIIAEDAFSVASHHSVGLIDIKWGTFMRPQSRYVTYVICWRNANLFQWEFPGCSNRMSWKQSAGHSQREAVKCMREKLKAATLQARSEEHLKHPDRWLLFEHFLFVPKHVTLSQKMRLALLVTIPSALLTSSEVLSCTHRADMSLDRSEKCQLVPLRISSLFQRNVLKAVGRTQIEGSCKRCCKVHGGKTSCKTSWKLYPLSLASKKWGALEAPWRMTPIRAFFVCSKACDIIAEDAFSVASQHSSVFVSSISRHCMIRTWRPILVDFRTEIGRSQNSHFLFLNIARRAHTTHHVDKRKEPGRMPY